MIYEYISVNLWWSSSQPDPIIPGLARVRCVGYGLQRDPDYFIRGRLRQQDTFAVFQYTISGHGLFHDGRASYAVPAGHGFLCLVDDPRVSYQYPANAKQPWEFVFISWYGMEETIRHLSTANPIVQLPINNPLIKELLRWKHYKNSPVTLDPVSSHQLCNRTICEIVQSRKDPEMEPHALLNQLLRFVDTDEAISANAESVAERLSVSREHLSRLCKQHMGSTLSKLLQQRRIKAVCAALLDPDCSITAVATTYGFTDTSHLARMFRSHMGMSPKVFRQAAASGNNW